MPPGDLCRRSYQVASRPNGFLFNNPGTLSNVHTARIMAMSSLFATLPVRLLATPTKVLVQHISCSPILLDILINPYRPPPHHSSHDATCPRSSQNSSQPAVDLQPSARAWGSSCGEPTRQHYGGQKPCSGLTYVENSFHRCFEKSHVTREMVLVDRASYLTLSRKDFPLFFSA